MKKQMLFKTKGMNKDLSVSAFNPEFAFENMNLRLSTNEGNTLMSWVNEKGTSSIGLVTGDWEKQDDNLANVTSIEGTPIGTAIINHKLVVFTTAEVDRIYILKYGMDKISMLGRKLYQGKLNFSTQNPLETLVSYESETIQKVYWVDGVNQPRVINIAASIDTVNKWNTNPDYNEWFDFIPTLQLNETVKVKKILGGNGMFAPGVIQYAFTYYNKYGQESNIFYTSPLLYISHADRGASPEDKVDNAFRITIENLDTHFDYLRIYSIQRTSINGTPIVKRIQDIEVRNLPSGQNSVSYTDVGTSGNSVDPTELLYKVEGGITVNTMEQKGNTLFLGNIKTDTVSDEGELRKYFEDTGSTTIVPLSPLTGENDVRRFKLASITGEYYKYGNQLTAYNINDDYSVPCGGFKKGDYYRCGVQFQDTVGKWSSPIWIKDVQIGARCDVEGDNIKVPVIKGSILETYADELILKGFKRVRPVVVFPNIQDRVTICQGVLNKTLLQDDNSYYQSSWFFRPHLKDKDNMIKDSGCVSPKPEFANDNYLEYTRSDIEGDNAFNPDYIRAVEIEGNYYDAEGNKKGMFKIDNEFTTLHSPDIEFDDSLAVLNYNNLKYKQVGFSEFTHTMSDIDIQTESPTISSTGIGFIHKTFKNTSSHGIVSGVFYDDFSVNDSGIVDGVQTFEKNPSQLSSMKYLIYPWQSDGSLNNDINRPANTGTPTAILKKKVISNLRYAKTVFDNSSNVSEYSFNTIPVLFSSDEVTALKMNDTLYMGNVDTIVSPGTPDGAYFAYEGWEEGLDAAHPSRNVRHVKKETPFESEKWGKTFSTDPNKPEDEGLYVLNRGQWTKLDDHAGEEFIDLAMKKEGVRMKYKSTSHLAMKLNAPGDINWDSNSPDFDRYELPIIEIRRNEDSPRFGGTSSDALKEATWIPCGEPVRLDNIQNGKVNFEYSYGDTYYQRYDCLKTYAFTPEDKNQIVEIGSFMLETHVNIDGRYDRNRGQLNNLNMSPRNFNLLNPVYSQIDNFFSYKIMDEDAYQQQSYPNQVVWSMTKESGAEVDAWTHITMASILELDGDRGTVNKLIRLNDQLLCLQDSAISRILYDERVQIATNENVPIEIGNSGKVQGKTYMSNTVGCSNKWSVVSTPAGIYFMDSNDKSIYRLGEGLVNVSQQGGFNSWCKNNITAADVKWTPIDFNNFVGYYDKLNQDVLYINKDTALAFSEKFGCFTSFYDYNNTPFFCNLDDTGIWIKADGKLWKHQANEEYCKFFDENKPYWMILVGNPEPQLDKIFTNLEFRACIEGEGTQRAIYGVDVFDNTFNFTFHPKEGEPTSYDFVPYIPFDSLETWNEYQHGIADINIRNGHNAMIHHRTDSIEASLKRKFRIWRCDIPRDNYAGSSDIFDDSFDNTFAGVKRKARPMDRMRNTWLYIKLMKEAEEDTSKALPKAEIHDVVMTYFG